MATALAQRRDIRSRFCDQEKALRYRDRWASGKRRRTHEREATALTHLLAGLGKLETAIDIGSGTGRLAGVLAASARHVVQLDVSQHMLDVARAGLAERGVACSFTQADCLRLPLADGCVDLVFCHRLLNHLPRSEDRKAALAELRRVSRRYVVVSCLSMPWPVRLARQWWDWLRGKSGGPEADGHVSSGSLQREARAAGFRRIGRTQIRRGLISAAFMTFAAGAGER